MPYRTQIKQQSAVFQSASRFSKALVFGLVLLCVCGSQQSFSNPAGGQVSAGSAVINQNNNAVQINQSSNKAVIDWQSYNVAHHESVHYQQPNSSSITLNRINPANGVAKIYGQISANGQVWLVNPAGIWFGPSAHVDVAGLVASTAGISNQDFMSGQYKFIQDQNWNGAIINEGIIKVAEAGLVALIGNGVVNNGLIEAKMGTVILASGSEFTINFSGNDFVSFSVDKEVLQPALDNNGEALRDGVKNTGRIIAPGGKVLVTAKTASDILDHAINLQGVVNVKSVAMQNGELILDGGEGKVFVNAKIIANGKKPGQTGGTVKILARHIELDGHTSIDVSGNAGGGTVLVGGNAHGLGVERRAADTFIGADVVINASALQYGNAGKVVIWSDAATHFNGTILARGGAVGGNGGWVETSGGFLVFNGAVDTGAAHGVLGSLLLDPKFIEINATTGVAYSSGVNNLFANNSAGTTILTPTSINAANANITLQANTDVTFTDALNMTNSTRTLTVQAGRSILINADITTTNGAIVMTANDNAAVSANRDAGAGSIVMAGGTTISSGTGAMTFTVGSTTTGGFTPGDISLVNLTKSTTAAITLNSPNAVTISGAVNAGSGPITVNTNTGANAAKDFNLTGSLLTTNTSTTAVAINVNAAAGGTGAIALGGNITTGSGGRITLATNTGANTTGGSITQTAGTLSVGAGTLVFSVPTASSSAIGSLATPILTTSTATLTLTLGSGGAFVTNTGALTLGVPTITAANYPLQILASGTLTLPAASFSTGTGNLTLKSTAGALATVATRTLTTTSGKLTLLGATALTINSALTTSSGDLDLSNTVSGSNITLATAGTITSTSGNLSINSQSVLTLNSAINVGSGTVSLLANTDGTGANSFVMATGSSITTTNSTANAVAINVNTAVGGSGAATLFDILTGSGGTITVRTDTGGNITGGSITRGGTASLNVGTGTVKLFAPVVATAIGAVATPIQVVASNLNLISGSGGIFVTNTGASSLDLAGVNTTGAFTLNSVSSTGITDSAAVTVTGVTTLVAGATQNITLNDVGNNFATLAVTSANNVTINDINGIILGADTISGNFNLTTAGAITQSGTQIVTGTTTITAGSGNNITLATAANDFGTFAVASGNAVSVRDANNIILGASTISGTYLVTASGVGGGVTQSGVLNITGAMTLVTSTTNNINLSTSSNDFSNVLITSGNNVSLRDLNALVLGTSTVTGTLDVTTAGSLTQNGTVIVTGATTLDAGSANDITLATATNNFSTVNITNANNATLGDAGALIIGTATVANQLNLTARGALTQSGAGITANSLVALTLVTAGAVITIDNPANDVVSVDLRARNATNTANAPGALTYRDVNGVDVVAANTTSTVSLTAGGAMTQSGSMTGTTLSAKTLNNGGAAITFNNAANAFTTINLQARNAADTASAVGAINYVDANSIAIANIDTASSFDLTAGTAITQTGAMNIVGATTLTANLINTDISLASFANNFAVTPVLAVTGAGTIRDFSLRNTNAAAAIPTLLSGMRNLTFTFDNNGMIFPTLNITGTLTATANGAITQSGSMVVTGITTLNPGAANNITLNNGSNNFSTMVITTANNVGLTDINALIFGGTTVNGNLDVVTNGAITDTGALVIAGTATFTSGLGNDITLNTATNNFNSVAILQADDVTLVDINALSFAASTISNTLTVTTAGTLSQTGAIVATGTSTFNVGAANSINLNNAGNNFSTVTTGSNTNVTLRDSNALNLGAMTLSGDLNVIAGGALTDSGNLVVNGVNGVNVTATGGITFNSAANQIARIDITNLSSGGVIVSSIVPMTINSFTQTGSGAVTFTDTGLFSVANGVTVNTNNSALAITATDLDLGLTGALNSGSNDITLTQTTVSGSIGLGTVGTMSISGSELQRMTAANLNLTTANNSTIIVDSISATNSANISGTTTLNTTAGTLGAITFQGIGSTFNALSGLADNGILLNANLTTQTGILNLNADVNGAAGGNDSLQLNANLSAAGALTLSALTGGIILGTPVSLTGLGGVTVNHSLNGGFNLTVDSGSSTTQFVVAVGANTAIGTGVGAAITLNSTGATTFSGALTANSGIQASGPVIFASNVTLNNGTTGSTFNGLVTLNSGAATLFSGFDGLAFNGGLQISGGAKTIDSQGSNLTLGLNASKSVTLGTGLTLQTEGGDINFNATATGANAVVTDAGSGNVFLQAFNSGSTLSVTANNLSGNVDISALTIALTTGNFFGLVNGGAGEAAIRQFTVINPIVPGTIFFNGIDIALLPPAPTPPNPPVPPLPIDVLPQLVFPTNYGFADLSEDVFYDEYYPMYFRYSNDCVQVGSMILLCGKWNVII